MQQQQTSKEVKNPTLSSKRNQNLNNTLTANEEALTDIESNTAWRDEEDDQIKINLNSKNKLKKLKKDEPQSEITGKDFQNRLREQFEKLNSKSEIYKWATAGKTSVKAEEGEGDSESESNENSNFREKNKLDSLLKTSKSVLETTESSDSNILKITQMKDLNKDAMHNSIISALEFSPIKENLAFTTGLDQKLKLFTVSETKNKSQNLKTINTQDLPIHAAKFSNSGTEILISGKKKHFFVYDLEADKLERCPSLFANKHVYSLEKMFVGQDQFAFGTQEGYILVHDLSNKCFRYDIKINGSVNSVCFDRNGINLYAVGDQSEIYIFDLRKYRTCVNKVNDTGNYNTTCMDISRDNSYIATGSYSGIVNLYSTEDLLHSINKDVEPLKTMDNLTTTCDFVKFNKSTTKLSACSKWKKHSLKIMNLQTKKVYSNFPNYSSKIKYAICFDYSINDKYMAVGNDEGRALLYKLDN